MNTKVTINKNNGAVQLLKTISEKAKEDIANIPFDTTSYATVISYNISTRLAIINYDFDTTNIEIKNLSNAHLNTGDYVLVKHIRGNPDSKYIDKNITSPNRQQDFINATLQNSWTNINDGKYPVAYMKDTLGNTVFRGTVHNGANYSVIFTLPVGYRPSKLLNFAVVADINGFVGFIQVLSNGEVSALTGNNTYINFGEIRFRAEQ